ncbi:MAG: LysM peptidoglycan-binding domain-containing protein, partial [Chrysiogenales bacterium]
VKDSNDYSPIEKNTMRYIRDSYTFTLEADRWFRTEIRKWAAGKDSAKKTVKKSTKKAAKKVVKKSAKKSAKKSVKKTVKKSAKKIVKKTLKKSAPKAVKKTTPKAPSPQIRQRPYIPPSREEYEYEERMQPVRSSSVRKRRVPSGIIWLIGLILAAVIIGLFVSPECGNRAKKAFTTMDAKKETAMEKPESAIPQPMAEPVEEVTKEKMTAPAPVETTPVKKEIEGAYYYTVQPKDDLISISRKLLNDYSKWKDIYEANRDIITTPYVIHPGQRLRIPGLEGEKQ